MKTFAFIFLTGYALWGQTCQPTVVAGRLSSDAPFPAPAVRFPVDTTQLAVTPSGQLLFAQPTQIVEVDGVLVNPWAPAFYKDRVSWRALLPAPDSSLLTIVANQVIRLHPDGTADTIAGLTQAGYSGDGGPAAQARLNAPSALAFLPDGSLLIADSGNFRIRRLAADQTIDTIAGNGGGDATLGEGGPALSARIGPVTSLAILPDGEVYFVEGGPYGGPVRIREITPDGRLITVAGSGTAAPETDNVPLANAGIAAPATLATGPDGRLYILDGRTIRYLSGGTLHVIRIHPAASVPANFALAPDGSIYLLVSYPASIVQRFPDGTERLAAGNDLTAALDGVPATALSIVPSGPVTGPDGLLYFLDYGGDAILRLKPDGTLQKAFQQKRSSPLSYQDDHLQQARQFSFDAMGNFIFPAQGILYRGTADGNVSVVAGGGPDTTSNFDGPAVNLSGFFTAARPLVAPDGSIYAVETRRGALLRITPDGHATVVWTSPPSAPGSTPDFSLVDGSELSWRADGNILASGNGGLAEIAPPAHRIILSDHTSFNTVFISDFFEDGNGAVVFLNGTLSSLLANGDVAQYGVDVSTWGSVQGNSVGGVLAPDRQGSLYFVDGRHNQIGLLQNYAACTASTAPQFTVNPYPYPTGPSYAPGMPVTVTGVNLGPAATLVTHLDASGLYPFQAADVQVAVNGVAAPILSTQSTALTFQIPYGLGFPPTPAGSLTNSSVTVSYHGFQSGPFRFALLPAVLSLVRTGSAAQQDPFNTTLALNPLIRNQDGSVNSASNPAVTGGVISISFYGVGELMPPRQTGESPWFPMRQAALPAAVYYQGQYLVMSWSGEVPGQPGLYQVNALLPNSRGTYKLTLAVGTAVASFFVYVTSK